MPLDSTSKTPTDVPTAEAAAPTASRRPEGDVVTAEKFLTAIFGDKDAGQIELRGISIQRQKPAIGMFTDIGAAARRGHALDLPGHGVYFGTCTRKATASGGTRHDLDQCFGVWLDVDTLKDGLAKQDVIKALRTCPRVPSIVIDSGGGIHAYWLFHEPVSIAADSREDQEAGEAIEAILKHLARVFAGDTSVCELARIMRLPGTHNHKPEVIASNEGRPALVQVMHFAPDCRYDLAQLAEWLGEQRTLVAPIQDEQALDPFLDAAMAAGLRQPLNVQQALADMKLGDTEHGIHRTQVQVAAAMVSRGYAEEEIKKTLLEQTSRAAGKEGQSWDWRREERGIDAMIDSARAKFGPSAKKSNVVQLRTPTGGENGPLEASEGSATTTEDGPDSRPPNPNESFICRIGRAVVAGWAATRGPLAHDGVGLWSYAEGVWRPVEGVLRHELAARIQQALEYELIAPRTASVENIADWIERHVYKPGIVWDKSGLVVCRNGALDPVTGELHAHSAEHYATSCLDLDFDPNAQCPTWSAFLSKAFSDVPDDAAAIINVIQEWFGASLLRGRVRPREVRRALFIVGPSRSGKSQITAVGGRMFGPNRSALPIRALQQHFGREPLIRASAWIADDCIHQGEELDAEFFKTTVTGESVSIPQKHKQDWQGQLDLPVLLTANHQPRVKDQSSAVYNRSIFVLMNVVIPEHECDGLIAEKLFAELPGILNWALVGLDRIHARRRYDLPVCLQRELDELAEDNNPPAAWIEQAIEADPNIQVKSPDLLNSFKGYVLENFGRQSMNQSAGWRTLIAAIKAKFPKIENKKSNSQTFWRGIKLTTAGLKYREAGMRALQIEVDGYDPPNRLANGGSDDDDGGGPRF
jgi:P4 family phage/plasmid primase-like protien